MKDTTQQIIKEAKEKGYIPEEKKDTEFSTSVFNQGYGFGFNNCIDSFQLEKIVELAYVKLLQAEIERLKGEKKELLEGVQTVYKQGEIQALQNQISHLKEQIIKIKEKWYEAYNVL